VAVRERVAPILSHGAPEPPPQAAEGCQDVVAIFSRRLEGEIDPSACAELEAHIQSCAACRGRCDSLRATLTMCRNVGQAQVPADVAHSVREALREFLRKPA
jgi:RNA polymerase sigma-70 factor (ECF subfamily)